MPSSATLKRTIESDGSQPIRTSPPGMLYFTALCARLRSAWPRRAGSAAARTTSPGWERGGHGSRAARRRADALDAGRDDLVWIERVNGQLRLAGLDHRQVEQLVDELGEVIDLALDLHREVAHRGGVVDRARGQRLGQQLDRGQRRAELVADVRHEVAAHALDAPQRGDVVEREDQPPDASGTASTANCRSPRWPRSASPTTTSLLADRLPRDGVERRRSEGGDQAHADERRLAALGQRRGLGPARTIRSRSSTSRSTSAAAAGEQRLDGGRAARSITPRRGANA